MVQKFINTQYYRLHIITLIFGMILYNPLDIKFMDELCAFLLLILLGYSIIKSQDWSLNKAFLYILGIFAFYFFYSIYIYSNSIKGIITDLTNGAIIQTEPLPPVMIKLLKDGGLVEHIKKNGDFKLTD